MKNFFKKAAANVITKTFTVKRYISKVVQTNHGMEVVQVLIIVIVSITLGGLLLTTLKTQFVEQLGAIETAMTAMFS